MFRFSFRELRSWVLRRTPLAMFFILAACGGGDASGPAPDTTPRVTAVSVSPASPTVLVGDQAQLTANVTAVNGASTAVTWSSSNTAIVSVGAATGLITGVAVGTASVTATSVADPSKSATVPVAVTAPPQAVLSVVVQPSNPTVVVGDVITLTANVTVVSGASTAVTWSTSNAAVATVSPGGQVTALAAGVATITATSVFDGSKRGSVSLIVTLGPGVLSVTIASAPAVLVVGTTAQLSATVATVGGASTAVTWNSSASAVATVSATGLVSAVMPGNVMITATSVVDPTKQASVTIRVDAVAAVLSVTVSPTSLSLSVGSSAQLTATVTVANNASQQVVWSSSASVATVDQTGKVTAVAAGATTVRATAQADATKFAESTITVTPPQFPSVASVDARVDNTFSPTSVDIARGGTVTWVFSAVVHNVTFVGNAGAPAGIGNTANASVSRSFATAGTFMYECTIHAGMQGMVVVH